MLSSDKLRFFVSQMKQRLWVKQLVLCVLSIGGTFIAMLADNAGLSGVLPEITIESVESLLSIMASSMLVIATFAVGSMVAAYASASAGATPRSIPLVIADDVTQNALSAFLGAFIFSIVSLITVQNGLFESAGLFAIFILTLLAFVIIITTFVRWVDRIARLGRVVNTIEQVEKAAAEALDRRRHGPTLGAMKALPHQAREAGIAICSPTVGYVQHIDLERLQSSAAALDCRVIVKALPGTFVYTRLPLLSVTGCAESGIAFDPDAFSRAFTVSSNRTFEVDPRFGLLALSEIADLFDDAFTAIARDGAGMVEVSIRLQKACRALAETGDTQMAAAARKHSRRALAQSEAALVLSDDIDAVRAEAAFSALQAQNHGSD